MHITVVICTWNRANLLDLTLTEMRRLVIPSEVEWELLVVNNNCTDHTDQVIQKHAAVLPVVRLFEPKAGKTNACNLAIAHAKGDWIVWTDDDVLVDPDWLGAFVRTANRYPEAVAIGGKIVPWFHGEPDPELIKGFPVYEDGYCGLDLGPEERPVPANQLFHGANMAFNCARVKGLLFDTRLGPNKDFKGGEDDLAYDRLARTRGELAVWSPRMSLRHYVGPERMTLRYLRRFFTDAGEQLIKKNGVPAGPRLLGCTRWLLRCYFERFFGTIYQRFTKGRVAYYRSLRDYWLVKGMVRGCRKTLRANHDNLANGGKRANPTGVNEPFYGA